MRFVPLRADIEAFDAANELLKLVVRRPRAPIGRRVLCFHSWRAALAGQDSPLDNEELAAIRQSDRLLHLVGKEEHRATIARELGHQAVVLPLTTLQAPDVYRDTGSPKDFDVFFSCMFTDDHIRRKNVDLLFAVLDRMPSLRVAWVGGYDAYERWLIEEAYNRHFETWGRDGLPGAAPWSEDESSMCWHLGGGVFAAEHQKQEKLRSLIEETRHRGYRIQFYANLGRAHVVHLLNRCRAAVTLSSADLWPRSVTEALACGTPAIAIDSLLCGLEALGPATGVVVSPEPEAVVDGLERAWRLDREAVRREYFSRFGLQNGVARLVAAADSLLSGWGDIVTIERPAETRFKGAVRAQLASLLNGSARLGTQ